MANFVKHEFCSACGSSDGKAIYKDGSHHCFVCKDSSLSEDYKQELQEKGKTKPKRVIEKVKEKVEKLKDKVTQEQTEELKSRTSLKGGGYRGIRDDVLKFFQVRTEYDTAGKVEAVYYPATENSELVGWKCRTHPKQFGVGNLGRTGNSCEMFGQFFHKTGGKTCLIVGGEHDAMAAHQMLKDYYFTKKWDFEPVVVSPLVGETGCSKQIAANYAWFDKFDKIIVGFDNDKAGKVAVDDVVAVLPKGKAFVATWGLKDPNEMLEKDKARQFISNFYDAKKYVPVGVLPSSGLYERIIQQTEIAKVPFPPFMKKLNEMFVGGMPLGYIFNVAADTGIGKCLAKDTLVMKSDYSLVKVQDIQKGDFLVGPNGLPRKVLGISSGFDKMYRVDQVNGVSYTVNSAHILSLKHSTSRMAKSGQLRNLNKGDVLNINVKDYMNLTKTQKSNLKGWKARFDLQSGKDYCLDESYLLGWWLADGTSSKAQITINKSDSDLINLVDYFCEKFGYVKNVSLSNDREGSIAYDFSKGFYRLLKDKSLLNNKHVPDYFFNSSLETKLNLIAGFCDGDAHLSSGCYDFNQKKCQLTYDMIRLMRSVGLVVKISESFRKCQNFEGDFYTRLTVSGDLNKIPNRLKRKKCPPRLQIKDSHVTGVTVMQVEDSEYYGFTLDGDHLFCLQDGTVSHNTTYVNEMIYYWIFNSPHKIGIVSMELDAGQYGEVLLSRHVSRKLALMPDVAEKLEYLGSEFIKQKSNELMTNPNGSDRFYLLDNRDGSIEEIQNTIEELVVSCSCKVIILDPLQDLLDGLSNEEQSLFMKWAKGFIKSHGVTFVLINHMRKSDNSGEMDIMGSSTIIKSAAANIILKRDKLAEDPIVRNTTTVFVPKNRVCGLTGDAGAFYYDNETHTLHDLDDWLNNNS